MVILFLGDTHANLHHIDGCVNAIEKRGLPRAEAVIQLGDFGFFSQWIGSYLDGRQTIKTPTWFIDGNHEDHDFLDGKLEKWDVKNLTYIKRGTTIELGGVKILGIGGATSVDFTMCRDILDEDIALAMTQKRPDIIVSHDCPAGIGMPSNLMFSGVKSETGDRRLTRVLKYFKPDFWFFGHYHVWHEIQVKNIKTKLVCVPESKFGGMLFDTQERYYAFVGIDEA